MLTKILVKAENTFRLKSTIVDMYYSLCFNSIFEGKYNPNQYPKSIVLVSINGCEIL